MSTKNDGGPAFPVPSAVFDHATDGELIGMTLRDWFAGQSLAGMCANPDFTQATASRLRGYAFEIADQMLKDRQK